ncbi:type IV pilus modification PilV family protein [Paenisporosarcina antarctica]|uniref:Type II secretion system protein n=1 Tax=Paenisporosarcina antarctica TaxID=417367 RepID=A0A4P6ZXC4_9BACL|nr:prepilin-type N-terminal cleavage/methylation domain-containing protein [Paenisporosarcina antarctica]QBP40758.1 type II secretion system protein [Paenisporosarcina antarctica]
MKKYKKNSNQSGLTLVEVLAALVILGIVFISIMTVFPQMSLVNEKTETKLDTMNLAREEISKITNISGWTIDKLANSDEVIKLLDVNYDLIAVEAPLTNPETGPNPDPNPEIPSKTYKVYKLKNDQYSEYTFDLIIYDKEDLAGMVTLYKIILRVIKDGKTSSETYGYIEAR